MSQKSAKNNSQLNHTAFGHAVVIGSSIAGLTTARILADHFSRVTIIDRDRLPETPEFRRGIPQAHHPHTLPLRGQTLFEQLFPGLMAELLANGATSISAGSEMAFFIAGAWHQLRRHSGVLFTASSRPLLEATIYRRLASHPRIYIIQEHEAVGLQVDRYSQQVTGVQLRSRRGLYPNETRLLADLVVDASGRDSQAPQWLAGLGYTPPAETTIKAFSGYASRIYRFPGGFPGSWKTMYIKPSPPDSSRGGVIIPLEGDRWHVALVGMGRDYPPVDEAGFLAFARSLPTPQFYETIKTAEPLTKVYGYRRTESRLRHYDRLPRYLDGFLVTGDAAFALNPVYALGMTAAITGSLALERSLKMQQAGHITGLARTFQQQLGRSLADLWQMVSTQDQRWPATEVIEESVSVRPQIPALRLKPAPVPAL
jgi:2-polyprenyl-6-methoxyphenol hydroxylase-like FAD-dependent oxidoreductase